MSVTLKLYRYYTKKILVKNWLRISIFTLLLALWWFAVPWGIVKWGNKESLWRESRDPRENREPSEDKKISFSDFTKISFGQKNAWFKNRGRDYHFTADQLFQINRWELENLYEQFCQEVNGKADPKKLEDLVGGYSVEVGNNLYFSEPGIRTREAFDKGEIPYLRTSFAYTADNLFFFQKTDGETEGLKGWKLLNNIAWWSLSSWIILYWFIWSILDFTFFRPHKDGEESSIISFTPGIKRSDILGGKVLAFLTFYALAQVLLFLIPFSIYYFWVGKFSFSLYALLILFTTVIGPVLFFGLILAPYLWLKSLSSVAGTIYSLLVPLIPALWGLGKLLPFKTQAWPYTVEKHFFDPRWYTLVAVVVGGLALALYYFQYQSDDLNK